LNTALSDPEEGPLRVTVTKLLESVLVIRKYFKASVTMSPIEGLEETMSSNSVDAVDIDITDSAISLTPDMVSLTVLP